MPALAAHETAPGDSTRDQSAPHNAANHHWRSKAANGAAGEDKVAAKEGAPSTAPPNDIDISSVITQVTTTTPAPAWGAPNSACSPAGTAAATAQRPGTNSDLGWRERLLSAFCCFAPGPPGSPGSSASSPYHYGSMQPQRGPAAINSMMAASPALLPPPTPTRVYREAVIGAKLPEDYQKKVGAGMVWGQGASCEDLGWR